MFWDSLKRLFGFGKVSNDPLPVHWLAPADNPWRVPVLDVRPFTQSVLSTSSNIECAQNAVSYGNEDGSSFVNREPDEQTSIPLNLRYRIDGYLADGALFIPAVMEHKWAIFLRDAKILFVRSWTRQVHAVAEVRVEDGFVHVDLLRGVLGSMSKDDAMEQRFLDALLRTHVLDIPHPVPLPANALESPDTAAQICFSMFGNLAWYATSAVIPFTVPEKPMRSYSLLHIAVARGDMAAVDTQIRAGVPATILDREGLSVMHWALTGKDVAMIDHLLAAGVPVDIRSDEGATLLMNAIQDKELEKVQWLVDRKADVNAADDRGFTPLHRAAEMGLADTVSFLLAHGANADARAGEHTPCSLARMRGEDEIVRLLEEALK
jgi:ankyrin repeat protein